MIQNIKPSCTHIVQLPCITPKNPCSDQVKWYDWALCLDVYSSYIVFSYIHTTEAACSGLGAQLHVEASTSYYHTHISYILVANTCELASHINN